MTTYRVDWAEADDAINADPHVFDAPSRESAMRIAATTSRKHGTAYAIATGRDGRDTGQRVYDRGRFSYAEGEF